MLIQPLRSLFQLAADLVDGAQLVPHAPVDVQASGVDFLAFSGHKMLGPTASGGLYARRDLLEEMEERGLVIGRLAPEERDASDSPRARTDEGGSPAAT